MEGLWTETDKIRSQHGYDSSSNSNSSSIASISSSSNDSDCKTGASELEADADSLSCRQSGLSSNDQSAISSRKLVCWIKVLDFSFLYVIIYDNMIKDLANWILCFGMGTPKFGDGVRLSAYSMLLYGFILICTSCTMKKFQKRMGYVSLFGYTNNIKFF